MKKEKNISMDESLINQLNDILERNLENEQFGVKELAAEIGISRSQLHRKLNSLIDKSCSQFIREYRLQKAMEMLQEKIANVSEIAYRVGFSSPTYFNTCFKDYYGYPPGEVKYRAANTSYVVDGRAEASKNISDIGKLANNKKVLIILASIALIFIGYFLINAVSKTNHHVENLVNEVSKSSIAVLPFKNLSDNKESEYFAEGVAQSIQSHLNKITGLKLISETSTAQYRETTKTSPQIATELNVSHLLVASVQEYEDKVRVIVSLIDAKKDELLWSDTYDRDLIDIFNIQSEISKQIATELEVVLSPAQISQIEKIPTTDIEAYNLYQKGKHFFNMKNHLHGKGEKSVQYLREAIEKDPEFALAHAALATVYLFSGENLYKDNSVELVEKLALRALALDSTISEAHVALGTLACMYEWNWEKAQKEFQHAIRLNPNNSDAYIHYSQFLYSVKGEPEKARNFIEKALQLDPLSYVGVLKSAQYYLNDDKYEKTFEETSKLKEINEQNMYSYWINFHVYDALGNKNKAINELVTYYNLNNTTIDSLELAYDINGLKGVYSYYTENNIKRYGQVSNFNEFVLYADAQAHAYFGNNERAFEYLEVALERRCSYLYEIKYDPSFINLRSEPRFLNILDKMNLGHYN
ncbi:helix-turn-helix domain-containing protein [Aurantibacter crassamenti]|uniref:helix-turn-helix domain-containing protein n=1 Tax=Aurantibacter crassamenti TaxID=1837375 RepID=UPI001939AD35|nr:helix-turn-helix domain-containing protein [Aurantibacter crassamenti]MBM1105977.1 helix-turn-helix domain-containing protein [Aurantibacter crassamenti]